MRGWGTIARTVFIGSFLAVSGPLLCQTAQASQNERQPAHPSRQISRAAAHSGHFVAHGRATGRRQYARGGGGISCVPFARADSGISVTGNAWQWWDNAAGIYARGSVPEPGSVLTFRANGRMHLGHVAVVSRIVNAREIEIDHANWWGPGMRGGVARNIPVVDISEANDWTAVRVGLGQSGEFGSVYPTYGFIYDRPDTGIMTATNTAPAPQPELNPAPSDLRPRAERGWQTYEEVAEAPGTTPRHRKVVHLASSHIHRAAALTTQR